MYLKFLASLLFLGFPNGAADTGEILVNIENIKSDEGVLIVALFDNEDDFLKKFYRNKIITLEEVKNGPVKFEKLPPGRYSVSVIHDQNKNGELDTNWAGIPKEPFGFSKKSFGNFGPPSFKDTCVDIKNEVTSTTVKMKTIL
ncbi:MAG: DUF2141 domain-containing protein [Bacteroidota bacterium]